MAIVESAEIRGCSDDRNSIHRNLKEKKKIEKKKKEKRNRVAFSGPTIAQDPVC